MSRSMAKDQGVNIQAARGVSRPTRSQPAKPPAGAQAVAAAATPKRRTSPAQFFREVRVEARKITWTSWRETWITSVMVFLMVAMTAVFFSVVDVVLRFFIQQLLQLAG